MEKISENLSSIIANMVKQGFETEEEILEQAFEYAADEYDNPEELEPKIKQLTADLLAAHRAEQKTWETKTDCDRLDEAFAVLNREGVVARQHFTCCNTCGHTDIWEEIEEEEEKQPVHGYLFYHLQSTENAANEGTLYLTYGTIADNEEALASVAQQCIAVLRRTGLNATWGGDSYSAIVVDGIVWRKRRE